MLDLLCEGLAHKEIAERLGISHRTVQEHLYSVRSNHPGLGLERSSPIRLVLWWLRYSGRLD